MAEEDCKTQGPLMDAAMYMCNGICVPAIIPCNNTCLSGQYLLENWTDRRGQNISAYFR